MGKQEYSIAIEELVKKIGRREIRLPEMQRGYVWTATRVRDLLDSLYRDYPSGTILTWETGGDEQQPTRDFAITQQENRSNAVSQLLLDGQQRLTSLSAILNGEPVAVKGRKRPIDILFNLEHPDKLSVVTEVNEKTDDDESSDEVDANDDGESSDEVDANKDDINKRVAQMAFIVGSPSIKGPHWVSVTKVLSSDSNTEFLKGCGVQNIDDPNYEKYDKRLASLRAIKKYMYDVHVLGRDMDYEEVTEIFVRVNSLGAKLRGSDLALAQITAKWRGSLNIFEEFQEKCKKNNFYFDLGIYIKNLIAFTTGQSKFKKVDQPVDKLKECWEESKKGFEFALNFLKNNVKIDSPALLSTPYLLITLGYFAHKNGSSLTAQQRDDLRRWVLVANAKGRYSRGSSETYLDQDLGDIKKQGEDAIASMIKNLETQSGRLDVKPSDLEGKNSRSAYFKTMFLVFRNEGAKDWFSSIAIAYNTQGAQHKLQFHHIFPQSILKGQFNKEEINDIANLCFISDRANKKISNKKPADYLPDIIETQGEAALIEQCIPTDRSLWAVDRYKEFLAQRRELIADKMNKFMGE